MRGRLVALIAVAIFSLAACSTGSEDMALLHREITDVQRSVQELQTDSLDKPPADVEAKGAPLSIRIAKGIPYSRNAFLKHTWTNSVPVSLSASHRRM